MEGQEFVMVEGNSNSKGWFARGWFHPLVGCACLVGCAVLVGSSMWSASVDSRVLVGCSGWLVSTCSLLVGVSLSGWLHVLVWFPSSVIIVMLSHIVRSTP